MNGGFLSYLLLFLGQGGRQTGRPRQGVGTNEVRPTRPTSPFVPLPPPQPSRRPLSFGFSPSRAPNAPFGGSLLPGGQATAPAQSFRFGHSSLVRNCNNRTRQACTVSVNNGGDCVRVGCCWDPAQSVRCARATFFVTSLREDQDFEECGVPAADLQFNQLAEPPVDAILLGIFSRIIGGERAPEGEWPWTAYIYLAQLGIPLGQTCGGTLVSREWIVTAAHCLATPNPALYEVALGINDLNPLSGNEVIRSVQTLIRHPQYDPVTFDFDVALLKLSAPVNFTEFVRPLCVVPSGTRTDNDDSPTFAGTTCTTVGWGLLSSPMGQLSDTLQQLNVVITPNVICRINTVANSASYSNRPVLSDTAPKFCALGADSPTIAQDSCEGDSGGPLFCLHSDGRYFLHGITSYGTVPCAINNLPGIYTKVGDPVINSFITTNVFT